MLEASHSFDEKQYLPVFYSMADSLECAPADKDSLKNGKDFRVEVEEII